MIPEELRKSEAGTWGNWEGSNILVLYRIVRRSDGAVVWPTNETPMQYKYPHDSTWGQAPFALQKATPDGKWLPGLAYRYQLTIGLPSELGGTRARARIGYGENDNNTITCKREIL